MNRLPRFLSVALLLCFASVAHAQQRPLLTEDVDIIPPGTIRIEAGIDFMQGANYTVSGIRGDLTRVGVIGINFGMGPNVEFQIEGVAQNYLSINSRGPSAIPLNLAPGANSTNDTGDFTISAKFKLRNETRRGPSLGFRFGVQLPNSSQGTGIGLNQTNAYRPGSHRQEVWSRRALQYVWQSRPRDPDCADTTVFAKRRDHLRRRRNLPYQQTVQHRR